MQRHKRQSRKAESTNLHSHSQQIEQALSDIIHAANGSELQYTDGSLKMKGNSLTISLTWRSKLPILLGVQAKLLLDGLASTVHRQGTSDSHVKNMDSFVKQASEGK